MQTCTDANVRWHSTRCPVDRARLTEAPRRPTPCPAVGVVQNHVATGQLEPVSNEGATHPPVQSGETFDENDDNDIAWSQLDPSIFLSPRFCQIHEPRSTFTGRKRLETLRR